MANLIKKEGNLEKQSKYLKNWRNRWTVLQAYPDANTHYVFTYKTPKEYKSPTETVRIDADTIIEPYIDANDKERKTFFIENKKDNDKFLFTAKSTLDRDEWIKEILTSQSSDEINQLMKQFEQERTRINKEIEILHAKNLSLHRLTAHDVHNKIQWWMYNDINYKTYLEKTMNILSERALNGDKDTKSIVRREFKTFMTDKTIINVCKLIDKYRYDKISAAKIGFKIYNYPLNNLLSSIIDGDVNGDIFMKKYNNNEKFIKSQTEYKEEE
eukprot:45844_1